METQIFVPLLKETDTTEDESFGEHGFSKQEFEDGELKDIEEPEYDDEPDYDDYDEDMDEE